MRLFRKEAWPIRGVKWLVGLGISMVLTSCFEIREEVRINRNGSGEYAFLLDCSASQSYLQTLAGTSPLVSGFSSPFFKIDSLFADHAAFLMGLQGIFRAESLDGRENYIFGFRFDFSSVEALNRALSNSELRQKNLFRNYFFFNRKGKFSQEKPNYLNRLLENGDWDDNLPNWEADLLKDARFKRIIFTEGKIKQFSNAQAILSKDAQQLTFSGSLQLLMQNQLDISNTLKFK